MTRYLAVFSAFFVILLGSAAPAAADGELGISSNGASYSPTFHGPLFSSAIKWVPGDSRTATFYVRNQSTDTASLTVTLLGDHVGQLLDSGDLTVSATGGGGAFTPASNGDEQLLLLSEGIEGGDVVPVQVKVDFSYSSPNDTQLTSTDLNFRVTLTQTADVSPGDGSTGALPDTGSPDITWIGLFGSILLGTGVAIVSRRRNNPQGESHV
ncbi:MAG: LPXTG cell wall anchor domain-containing protein [Aeromicrobium sp.]